MNTSSVERWHFSTLNGDLPMLFLLLREGQNGHLQKHLFEFLERF
jgi:hypothetical protein